MYNDGGLTDNLFTGYYDSVEQEYVYPDAKQNLVVSFLDFYLSAEDGDFTTDGVAFSSQTGDSEDITIGNAPAKVFTGTMLNPNGTMENLTWGDGAVYIGVATASAAADTYQSYPVHVLAGSVHYGINASGNAQRNTTNYALGGTPVAVISNADGTDVLFITDTKMGRYNGSFSVVSTPTAAQTFIATKFREMSHTVGVLLDANGCPSVYNSVELDTKTTYTYIPMGVFNFADVESYGVTFQAEAYDHMRVFDQDATAWVEALDFTTPKTIGGIIGEIMTQLSLSYTIDASAVNTSVSLDKNPITNYASTYWQVLKWLAEAIGCNVRMSRDGSTVEFYVFNTTPVATITPNTVIANTRTKTRYSIPQITRVVCYNTVGAGYEDGVSGPPYYVVANPFIDPSTGLAPVTALLGLLDDIPLYYPTAIGVACADPRIDAGDFVTVTLSDGTTYDMPVMQQVLSWNGVCRTVMTATGNQTREIPQSMTGSDLSSVVNSNPTAVVNKIAAEGIDADWITAGTISDRQGKNTWNLNTGKMTITNGSIIIDNQHTYHYTDYSQYDVNVINQYINGTRKTLTEEQWEKYDFVGTRDLDGTAAATRISQMISRQQDCTKTTTVQFFPSGLPDQWLQVTVEVPQVGTAPAVGNTSWAESTFFHMAMTAKSYTALSDTGDDVVVSPSRITLQNAYYTKNIAAYGPTVSASYGSLSVASGTAFHSLGSFTIADAGTYLVHVHVSFPSNTTGRRMALISGTQDSNSAIASRFRSSAAPVNGAETYLNIVGTVEANDSTTYYINAQQNSGSSQTVSYFYSYVRLA